MAQAAFAETREALGDHPFGAMLVGSTPRGWFYDKSDLDIQVITERFTSDDKVFTLGLLDINITFIERTALMALLHNSQNSLQGLRLASQLEQSIILVENGLELAEFRRLNAKITPSKCLLSFYADLSDIYLQAFHAQQDASLAYTLLHKFVQCILMQYLLVSPTRIIKPKWNWRCIDAIDSGSCRLAEEILCLGKLMPLVNSGEIETIIDENYSAPSDDTRKLLLSLVDDMREQATDPDVPELSAAALTAAIITRIIEDLPLRQPVSRKLPEMPAKIAEATSIVAGPRHHVMTLANCLRSRGTAYVSAHS
jgi:hypothetical protein